MFIVFHNDVAHTHTHIIVPISHIRVPIILVSHDAAVSAIVAVVGRV